jgi:hypothetical protein
MVTDDAANAATHQASKARALRAIFTNVNV